MKREFLQNLDLGNGVKLSAETIDAIMAEHGRTRQNLDNQISTLTTERDGYKSQLDTANDTIKTYTDMDIDGIKRSAQEWEEKHKSDTEALQRQLADVKYGHAVDKIVDGLKFSSASAKKAYRADLIAKNLQLQDDGSLLGYADWHKKYQDNDASAFASDDPAPSISAGSNTGNGGNTSGVDALRAAFGLPAAKN